MSESTILSDYDRAADGFAIFELVLSNGINPIVIAIHNIEAKGTDSAISDEIANAGYDSSPRSVGPEINGLALTCVHVLALKLAARRKVL